VKQTVAGDLFLGVWHVLSGPGDQGQGVTLASVGDVNGDGIVDLGVGALDRRR